MQNYLQDRWSRKNLLGLAPNIHRRVNPWKCTWARGRSNCLQWLMLRKNSGCLKETTFLSLPPFFKTMFTATNEFWVLVQSRCSSRRSGIKRNRICFISEMPCKVLLTLPLLVQHHCLEFCFKKNYFQTFLLWTFLEECGFYVKILITLWAAKYPFTPEKKPWKSRNTLQFISWIYIRLD